VLTELRLIYKELPALQAILAMLAVEVVQAMAVGLAVQVIQALTVMLEVVQILLEIEEIKAMPQ
jgi:flagellar biosynthesis protein FliQ